MCRYCFTRWRNLTCGGISLVFSVFVLLVTYEESVEVKFYDWLLQLRHGSLRSIVDAVDDWGGNRAESRDRIKIVRVPPPESENSKPDRSKLAALLIKAVEGQARMVVFDIAFEGEGTEAGDNAMLRALENASERGIPVVLGVDYVNKKDGGELIPINDRFKLLAASWGIVADRPHPVFEADKVTRLIGYNSAYLTLADAAAEAASRSDVLGVPYRRSAEQRFEFVNFYGPPNTLDYDDVDVVLQLSKESDELLGKIIVVGRGYTNESAQHDKDKHRSVLNTSEGASILGVELQSTKIANLISKEGVKRMGWEGEFTLVVILSLIMGALGGRIPPIIAVCSAFVVLSVLISFTLVLLALGNVWVSGCVFWVVIPSCLVVCSFFPIYDVFISHRHATGQCYAQLLTAHLKEHGVHAFVDVNHQRAGTLMEKLLGEVRRAPNFVLLLTEKALDRCVDPGDLVWCELKCAENAEKNIISVRYPGYEQGDEPGEVSAELLKIRTEVDRYTGPRYSENNPLVLAQSLMKQLRGRVRPLRKRLKSANRTGNNMGSGHHFQ